MTSLMTVVLKRVELYRKSFMAAPSKWGQRVFGQRIPTKSDIRKDFLADLRMLGEEAMFMKDAKVLELIQGVVKAPEQEAEETISAIQSLRVPGE